MYGNDKLHSIISASTLYQSTLSSLESVLTGSYLDLVWSWTANATMWKTQRARTCIVFSNLLLI